MNATNLKLYTCKCLPSVTLEIKMPSSSPLKGVDPIPPAIDKPNPPVVLSI